jgi:uncharacterized Zn-finger protein
MNFFFQKSLIFVQNFFGQNKLSLNLSLIDRRYHQLTEHHFVKPHLCETCGKSYTSQCALNTHLAKEHGQPEVPCDCRSCSAKANLG